MRVGWGGGGGTVKPTQIRERGWHHLPEPASAVGQEHRWGSLKHSGSHNKAEARLFEAYGIPTRTFSEHEAQNTHVWGARISSEISINIPHGAVVQQQSCKPDAQMVTETALAQPGRLSIVNSFVCHCVFCLLSRRIVFIRGADLRPRKNSLDCAESGSQRENRNKRCAA